MRLIYIFMALLTVSTASAQTPQGMTKQREFAPTYFAPATISPNAVTIKGYFLIMVEAPDTATYVYTLSREKKVWAAPVYVPIKIPAIAFVNPYSNVDTQADYIRPAVNGSTVPLQVSFNVPFNGETKIIIEYANGNTPDVSATITIAGTTVPVVKLPKTTDWNTYASVTQVIAAQTGQKVVTVSFLPNVNFKSITFSK